MKIISLIVYCIFALLTSCQSQKGEKKELDAGTSQITLIKVDHQLRRVTQAQEGPHLDGKSTDAAWQKSSWLPIDQRWLGEPYTVQDFEGRYKLTWTPEALYILAEIKDDIFYDKEKNPLKSWWDDDCLEIFIDSNNSGGNHQYDYNAFAYHVALDGNVVDIAPGDVPTLYNSHVQSKRVLINNNTMIWECKVTLYEDTYKKGIDNVPKVLDKGQKIGFALAYCDNDKSSTRENFIGSVDVLGKDKNKGWIDAGIFGTIELIE